ncbi:putative glycerol kinase 5 [Nilaparvata lugens]|uniref:putative glycerol kinase 5 n=1 Tax=Nilaparvata lugens TaxID=108931 RepID=UPI00193C8E5A|nr:putative glycerol kinase 5 [Nilaparvata lugens]
MESGDALSGKQLDSRNKFVASLDIGTTSVRCHIINNKGETIGDSSEQVILHCPSYGRVEIEPDTLFDSIVQVIKNAIKEAGLKASDITVMGISCQRGTFITWNKTTGQPYHNFITWQDLRADSLVQQWNKSMTMKALRMGSKCLHLITRNRRFLAGSVLQLMNAQVTLRLLWVLQNVTGVREAADRGELMFGTVDTWLLRRLTGGDVFVTEVSCASATGLFDPFTMAWADWAFALFKLPRSMMPAVCDSSGDHFGHTDPCLFGAPIHIASLLSDQSASLFGSCCFQEGDAKVTIGTGSFLNVNTGRKPHASIAGTFLLSSYFTLLFFSTCQNCPYLIFTGYVGNDPSESQKIATSVPDNDGVYFVPAFSGLQAPVNDDKSAAGFLGVKRTTRPPHFLRAVLESIAFRIVEMHSCLVGETSYKIDKIRVDGGVSRNDFIVQLISDLTNTTVERAKSSEMSVLGAATFAGLAAGIWKDQNELKALRKVDREFEPRKDTASEYASVFNNWKKAVGRFTGWYAQETA